MTQEIASSIQDLIENLSCEDDSIRMSAHRSLGKTVINGRWSTKSP
jgi:hypothetical protein